MKNYLRIIRKAKGITISHLSDDLQISNATISGFELGKRTINNDVLVKICRKLECTPSEIFGYEPSGKIPIVGHIMSKAGTLYAGNEASEFLDIQNRAGLLAIGMVGESMNKVAPKGSMIVFDPMQNDVIDLHGKYVVVEIDGKIHFKKMLVMGNTILFECTSFDPGFVPISIDISSIKILGTAVAVYHDMRSIIL